MSRGHETGNRYIDRDQGLNRSGGVAYPLINLCVNEPKPSVVCPGDAMKIKPATVLETETLSNFENQISNNLLGGWSLSNLGMGIGFATRRFSKTNR